VRKGYSGGQNSSIAQVKEYTSVFCQGQWVLDVDVEDADRAFDPGVTE
jgi:hypothetical protein